MTTLHVITTRHFIWGESTVTIHRVVLSVTTQGNASATKHEAQGLMLSLVHVKGLR